MRELRNINGHFVLIPVFMPVCMKCGIASRPSSGHQEDLLFHFETSMCSGTVDLAMQRAAQCTDRIDLEIQITTLATSETRGS